MVLACAALIFSILSGIRLPNIWSLTHFLFDYSEGVIKRGLIGEVLQFFLGHSISYGILALLCYTIGVIWLILLVMKIRATAAHDHHIWLLTAVVVVSPGFVFLFHEIGYFDHISLIIVFLCFLLPAGCLGLIGRTLLCIVMVVIHETFFVLFFPTVVVEYWIRAAVTRQRGTLIAVLLLVAPPAVAAYVMVDTMLPANRHAAYIEHIDSRAENFEVRTAAVKVLFRDGDRNMALNAKVWKNRKRWVDAFAATIFLLPLPFALIALSWNHLWRMQLPSQTRLLLGTAVGLGAISPLFLNFIAWDLWRFFCLSQVSAFLIVVAVVGNSSLPLFPSRFVGAAKYGLVVFAVAGAATVVPLFDGYIVEKPPYVPLLNHVIDAAQGDIPWFSVPTR
ncbi:MAG: hypothetical protein RIM84_26385 [Alphaproteobacteria bacterium]